MATKLKDLMEAEPSSIVDAVAASAQQIWQAGLGAFAAAQRDGGELFDKLVHDGAHLHQLTQDLAGDKLPGVSGAVGRLAGQIGRQASGSWEKIEKIFDDRVGRTLSRLEVPSRAEYARLQAELAELRARLDASPPACAEPARPARRAKAAAPAAGASAARARGGAQGTAKAASQRSPRSAGARARS